MTEETIRIQKFLAQAGLGSRRACDALVAAGRVLVNGSEAEVGTRVNPANDYIEVDGRSIAQRQELLVLMLNKPPGVVTTMIDDRGRPCVGELVSHVPQRLFHVGRLDEDTEGLLLLTNDGDLAHRLMHPSHGVQKTYVATVRGRVTESVLRELCAGVGLADGLAVADAALIRTANERWSVIELVLHEGRKRIVRRMCKAVGHPVDRLIRVRLGALALGDLAVGALRPLTENELEALIQSTI